MKHMIAHTVSAEMGIEQPGWGLKHHPLWEHFDRMEPAAETTLMGTLGTEWISRQNRRHDPLSLHAGQQRIIRWIMQYTHNHLTL